MAKQTDRTAATTRAILSSARALFAVKGYDTVSIDEIAEAAGCAKGAFYHHFQSKKAVFETILESIQSSLAFETSKDSKNGKLVVNPALVLNGIERYLIAANNPTIRKILLVDGPVVLGWQRWREIDDKYFSESVRVNVRSLVGQQASNVLVNSATQLLLGAIMEAALSAGASADPDRTSREHCATLMLFLRGLQR